MDKFEKAKKDIELSIENPKEYKKEKVEEIINLHKYPIKTMVSDIINSDNSIHEDYVYDDVNELSEDDGIEITPLTEEQKKIIGLKATKIYEMAIKIKNGEFIEDKDILSVAQNGIINSKEYRNIKSLKESEQKKYINELRDIIMDFAYQLAFDIQIKENYELGDILPSGMSDYYFSQYDEMFGYNPNTDKIEKVENVSPEVQEVYYDSLHLTKILQFIQTKSFLTGLHKNVSKRMNRIISSANKCINDQLPSKNSASLSRNIKNSMVSFKRIFPDLNEKQIKSFVVALSLFSKNNKNTNKYCGAYLLLINMNLLALSLICDKEKLIVGSAKVFYENLIKIKEELQKIKILKK